jgi:predicted RNA-binding Zn-ribbon protein involved in translation (DUF1610 family)
MKQQIYCRICQARAFFIYLEEDTTIYLCSNCGMETVLDNEVTLKFENSKNGIEPEKHKK